MLSFVADRVSLVGAVVVTWDQGGRISPTSINDTNNFYDVSPAVKAKVTHKKFDTPQSWGNLLSREDQVPGSWEGGNFKDGDALFFTDLQTTKDGPITIEFVSAADLITPVPVRAAGVNIQTFTDGDFDGVLRVIGANGVIFRQRRLGNSNTSRDESAIFLGANSDVRDIIRIELRTTNIVESGHAFFDRRGFAINQLSVIV